MQKKWLLFHATDFQSLMYPCFTFCRILGIFPYKINNSIFEISNLHYIVSIIITCILCVSELLIFYWYIKITNFKDVIMFLETNSYGILSSFVAVITFVLSSPRMRLLQSIMEISSRLSPKSFQKLSRLIHFKDIFGFFYVAGIIFINCFITDMSISFLIFSEYTALLVFQMDMLYMNCVCILKACLKEINNKLLHMQEFLVNSGSSISTMFYFEQRNSSLIINLKILRKQHVIISNTIHMLNKIFSLQLLATIFMTFFEIIFVLYYYIIKWDNGLFIDWNKNMCIFLIFMIYDIIKILLLVWACETGKNETQDICTMIHGIFNSIRDKRIKSEVVKV